jgi:hypothetical protein
MVREKKIDKLQKVRLEAAWTPPAPMWNSKMNLKLYELSSGGKRFVTEFLE